MPKDRPKRITDVLLDQLEDAIPRIVPPTLVLVEYDIIFITLPDIAKGTLTPMPQIVCTFQSRALDTTNTAWQVLPTWKPTQEITDQTLRQLVARILDDRALEDAQRNGHQPAPQGSKLWTPGAG